MARITGVRIYVEKIAGRIPEGSVLTVTELAREADAAGARRGIKKILSDQPDDVPYWRVVDEDGSLLDLAPGYLEVQREKLESEGIDVQDDRVDLDDYQWVPEDDS